MNGQTLRSLSGTEPSQDLDLILAYPRFIVHFPQRGAKNRFTKSTSPSLVETDKCTRRYAPDFPARALSFPLAVTVSRDCCWWD